MQLDFSRILPKNLMRGPTRLLCMSCGTHILLSLSDTRRRKVAERFFLPLEIWQAPRRREMKKDALSMERMYVFMCSRFFCATGGSLRQVFSLEYTDRGLTSPHGARGRYDEELNREGHRGVGYYLLPPPTTAKKDCETCPESYRRRQCGTEAGGVSRFCALTSLPRREGGTPTSESGFVRNGSNSKNTGELPGQSVIARAMNVRPGTAPLISHTNNFMGISPHEY